jgi:chromosome segregation ATPase
VRARAERAERELAEARAALAVETANANTLAHERDKARKALDEREGDMHLRIRAGYDKAVADSWRAKVAEVEKERDEARAALENLTVHAKIIAKAADGHRAHEQQLEAEVARLRKGVDVALSDLGKVPGSFRGDAILVTHAMAALRAALKGDDHG